MTLLICSATISKSGRFSTAAPADPRHRWPSRTSLGPAFSRGLAVANAASFGDHGPLSDGVLLHRVSSRAVDRGHWRRAPSPARYCPCGSSRARIRSRKAPERVQGRRAEALVPPRSGIRPGEGTLVAHAGGARRLVVEHCEGGATRSADEAALRERFGHAALVRGRRPARPTRPGGALRGHGGTGRTG